MATNLNNFENGAFIVSRSIFESEIWFKPPEYLKIWLYLFGKANHKTRKIKGYACERGQYFCDYKELLSQLEYKIGYRQKKHNESFMKNLMKYLRDTLMIATMKKPRGLLVTICNYEDYQVIKNYEKTNEKTSGKTIPKPALNQPPLSINKNVKNDKNKTLKQKEINIDESLDLMFKAFIDLYPNAKGKADAKKAWRQLFQKGFSKSKCVTGYIGPLTDQLFRVIITAVENQIKEREWKASQKIWVESWKGPAAWLRDKRWDDDVQIEHPRQRPRKVSV